MARFTTTLGAGLLLGFALVAFGPASARAASCSPHENVFGTIQSVQGNLVTLRGAQGQTATVLVGEDAQMNTHGYQMRPGTFARMYGCVENGMLHATQVNLAANSAGYYESREPITRSGVVRRVSDRAIYVWVPEYRTEMTWIVNNGDRFRDGERVVAQGTENTRGDFFPSSIRVVGQTSQTGSITLSGVVRRVTSGAIYVWEPAHNTETVWMVRDAGRFRVGEHVVGRGTENTRGDFFPSSIQFQ